MKKNRKIYSSDVRAEFRDNFDMIKRYKNLFCKKNSLIESKKSLYKTHNLYRSFINTALASFTLFLILMLLIILSGTNLSNSSRVFSLAPSFKRFNATSMENGLIK